MTCRLGRRLVALIAAYALALNALLAPFAMPAAAGQTAWTDICSSADRSRSPAGDQPPIEHHPACPLGLACSALACGAVASLGAAAQGEALVYRGPGRHIDPPHWRDAAIVPHALGPQLARAPPAA